MVASGLIIGYALAWPWGGYPRGDDAVYWANMAKMIARNPSYYLWSPDAYLGWQPFAVISPLAYSLIASLSNLSGVGVADLFQFCFAACVLLTGISIYCLSRLLQVPRLLSAGFAIFLWLTPSYWSMSIGGGTYDRVWYFPLIFFSVCAAYLQVRSINSGNTRIGIHAVAFVTLALLGISDLYDFLVALFFLVPLYLIGIQGIRQATSWLLRMFIGVASVDAWFLVPSAAGILHRTSQSGSLHEASLNPISWLVWPTQKFSWAFSHALNPLYIPVAALSVFLAYLSGQIFHVQRPKLALFVGAYIATSYFLVTGWAYVPSSLRLMAAYSSGDWIAFTLVVLIASGFGLFFTSKRSRRVSHLASISLFLALIATGVAFVPMMRVGNNELADRGVLSLGNALSQCCNNQYRAAIVSSRIIYRSINYYAPSVQVTGGRFAYYNQNPDYINWAADRIFFRADESIIPSIYFDDRPTYTRINFGGASNWYSSLFWLDWFAAKGIVFAPWEVPDGSTLAGYQTRGQFFSEYSTVNFTYGPTPIIQNNIVSPILIASNSTVIGVLTDNCPSETCYFDLLDSLSYLDLDSRYLIPVQLLSSDLVNFAPTILLLQGSTVLEDRLVQNYLSNGGRVVVFNDLTVDSPCTSSSSASPGPGMILQTNCSLQHLNAMGVLGSIELAQMILGSSQIISEPVVMRENQTVTNQFPTGDAFGISFTKAATGEINATSSTMQLTIIPSSAASYHQVNANASLNQTIDLTSSGYVSFTVSSNATVSLGVSFANTQNSNYWASNGGTNLVVNPGAAQLIRLPIPDFALFNTKMFFSTSDSMILSISTPALDNQTVTVAISSIQVQNGPSIHLDMPTPLSSSNPAVLEFTTNSTTPTPLLVGTTPYAPAIEVLPNSTSAGNQLYLVPVAAFSLAAPTVIRQVVFTLNRLR